MKHADAASRVCLCVSECGGVEDLNIFLHQVTTMPISGAKETKLAIFLADWSGWSLSMENVLPYLATF